MATEAKQQHSPGPWKVGRSRPGAPVYSWWLIDASGQTIANNEADAVLIAAAPELLAALEAARTFDDPGTTWPTPAQKAMLDKMDAAIAKARGEA